ncbi:MAG: CBS domain-containing protein [Pirellulales bacterium]|nr:CBS domain-containing protein [Pirellulales bacterium]
MVHLKYFGSEFSRDDRGMSSIEYALFLMIIVIVSTLGLNAFTLFTSGTFDSVACSLDPGSRSHNAVDNIADTHTDAYSTDHQYTSEDLQTERNVLIIEMLILSTALCAAAWAWHILRRQRWERRRLEEPSPSTEQTPDEQFQKFLEKRQQILRLLTNDVSRIFESRIRVHHLMSTDIRSVKPSARQEQILEEMTEHHIRHLLVCDDDGRLLGVVSNRDCRHKAGTKARELMAKQPATVSRNTTIAIAATMMIDRNISCLPVLEDGVVEGVLTTTDLLLSLQCSLQMLMKVATDKELLEKVLGTLDVTSVSASVAEERKEVSDSDSANDCELITSG